MCKKILATLSAVALVVALAIPAMAANVKVAGVKDGATLYSTANEWWVSTDVAGTVTVKDNKKTFEYDVEAGNTMIGLQKGYTGQLTLVGFEAAFTLWDEFLAARDFVYWNYFEGMDPCFYSKYWATGNNDCVEGLVWLYYSGYADTVTEGTLCYYIDILNNYAPCDGCELCDPCAYLEHDYFRVVTAPTCTNDGFTTFTCSVCGDSYDGESVDALGHIEVLEVAAEVVSSAWNGENGSDARFDVTLELTFTVSRGDEDPVYVIFKDAYYRNGNFNTLTETFEGFYGCEFVTVEITLSAAGSNQNAEFAVNAVAFESEIVCED